MTTIAGQGFSRHIENGDLSTIVQVLNSQIIHIDERDVDGQTFLMIASQVGHVEIVRELLKQPFIDVNSVDNDNWSALLNASKEGHEEVLTLLLNVGASVDHKDIGGWTALMWSCYKGHPNCAQILLENHANPNVKGEHHMSCLTWAAGRGHEAIVRLLLAHGAKVNTADKYGTTPLIWASRKGYAAIVEMLLHAGAHVDNAGMNSWTALLVSAKGGYKDVVTLILDHAPNVNAVDKDGYTALSWAAKDGHGEITNKLLHSEAYVNLPDRYGDTILIHAVKGGHLEVVKSLLKKYADVDVQGVDDKTALYWAVEKGHANIVIALTKSGANTEIPNKDGDTALLKAVRSRHYDIVRILLDKNAKVSSADKKGDTALHIAVRGRSKRIMELLLRNPKDGRLLYRPNKSGETAYQIDASKDKSILTQVFGTRNLNAADNIHGYELYSNTIADVLSEPSLNTPITVGLYAKWGSGKSFLTDQLKKDMALFAEQQNIPDFSFSILQGFLSFILAIVVGVVLWLAVDWKVGVGVGSGILVLQYIIFGLLILLLHKKDWDWCYVISDQLQRQLKLLKLLLLVLFCNQPKTPKREIANVKFLFTNKARLASVVGEKSITSMISTLSGELEKEFGAPVTRLYSVFKPQKAEDHGRFKTVCCIPYFVIATFVMLCCATAAILMGYVGIHSILEPAYTAVDSVLIAIAIIILLAVVSTIYTWFKIVVNIIIPPKRRINKIGTRIESLKSEGFMQSLKKEVELMSHMTNCMDSFLHTQTRLVIIVDGLDSCEQEKLLQVLDTLHMLFADRGSPFIIILAVDPHIIIKGIESNAQVFFRDTSINGHDYLRNMVQLPFYLQGQIQPAKRFIAQTSKVDGVHETVAESASSSRVGETRRSFRQLQRYDSTITTSSQLSLGPDLGTGYKSKKKQHGAINDQSPMVPTRLLGRQPSQSDLSRSLGKNSYFSDINPRSMKRLMNIIAVTGRLLRALQIDFSWYKLAAWINITEQWPYRLSWMILEQDDQDEEINDKVTLKTLYDRIQEKLPANKDIEPLLEIDRNVRKLELFLTNLTPVLTVGDMRRFLPCTINVDPYLRKLIRELQQNIENLNNEYAMGINNLLTPKNSDLMQGYSATVPNIRSRNSSGENQNTRNPSTRSTAGRNISASPFTVASNPFMQMMMNPGAMMNPALMNQYLQMFNQGGSGTSSGINQNPMCFQQQNFRKRKGPRVKLQGGLPLEGLSNMSMEGVCNLLHRLEGLSPQQLPQYQARIQESNITGFVLLTCELAELKTVMQMSFGDWELFKILIQMLRERDQAMSKTPTSSNDSLDDLNSPEQLTKMGQPDLSTSPIEVPQPMYPAHNSRNSSTPAATGYDYNNMNSPVDIDKQALSYNEIEERSELENMKKRRIKRVDSMVNDVIAETSVLQGMIDSVGIQEVLTEEETDEEEISPQAVSVTIENHVASHNHRSNIPSNDVSFEANVQENDVAKLVPSRKHSKKREKKLKKDYEKKDYEKTDTDGNTRRNSAYSKRSDSLHGSAGADDASDTESEKELELLKMTRSRKKSINSKSSVGDSASEPTSPVSIENLVKNKSDKSCFTVISEASSSQQKHRVPHNAVQEPTRPKSNASSLYLSEEATPVQSPTSSYEYLALKKLSKMDEGGTPSAFKQINPASSQHSSQASSGSGSVKLNAMSKTHNLDTEETADTELQSASHAQTAFNVSSERLVAREDNIDV